MNKRKWHYLLPPTSFEITCSKCGGKNITWSEYERCIWCFDCEIDDDKNKGIFDGPIPIHATMSFGINFDRYNMETDEIEIFDTIDGGWIPLDKLEREYTKQTLLNRKNLQNNYKNRFGENIFSRIKRYREFMNDDKV